MTAPQPAIPGSDSVRQQIAEALRVDILNVTAPRWAERVADALMPLVDRLRAEAKAEALEEAAASFEPKFGAGSSPRWLRDRAAAYRTNPSSEETH